MKRKLPLDPKAAARDAARDAARRAALRALAKARRTALKAGVTLSEWEGEFLGSVEDRVKTYGRAFADPEKGVAGAALSILQRIKLKEIASKATGEKPDKPRMQRRRAFKTPGK